MQVFAIHWDKLALDKDRSPLAPDYRAYSELEATGKLGLIVLRDQGKLVGYWAAIIGPGLHYSETLTAQMDMWNLLPGYEGGAAPLVLMRAVERFYRQRGVQRSFAGEKLHRPCGRLYEAFGYRPVEVHYSKWLGN